MKLLSYIKEKIMPRIKGSKNKSSLERETEQSKEFNYEEDDIKFDASYQTNIFTATVPPVVLTSSGLVVPTEQSVNFVPTEQNGTLSDKSVNRLLKNRLYLVEGEVQLSSRVPGRSSVVAKQMRLVSAVDDDQAIKKFVNYFAGLSDAESLYTVMTAAAMETIQ
jgi:hypothetical protein